jgi:hypothetical protein
MQEQESLTPADNELISALGDLRPSGGAIDRDRLMFQAGRASMRSRRWMWQGTTLVLAVALGISLMLNMQTPQRQNPVAIQIAEVQTFTPEPIAMDEYEDEYQPRPGDGAFLKLRNDVLSKGVDALPTQTLSEMNNSDRNWQNELLEQLKNQIY